MVTLNLNTPPLSSADETPCKNAIRRLLNDENCTLNISLVDKTATLFTSLSLDMVRARLPVHWEVEQVTTNDGLLLHRFLLSLNDVDFH